MSAGLAWLRRWGVSVASLLGGLVVLLVFRRGLPHVGWIVGYLLLLWLLAGVLVQVRDTLEASGRRTHRLVLTATEYTIQTLYHGVLLFVLPAYWAATTPSSVNAIFLLLLAALALLATFDPWYAQLVRPRWWLSGVFFLVSTFAALNVALPLVGVPPFAGLLTSAWIAVVALTPAVCRRGGWRWHQGLVVTAAAGFLAMWLAGTLRLAVPPAPLFVAHAGLGWYAGSVESVEPVPPAIPADVLHERGLVAYTAIYAPAGIRQPIEHVWRHEGRTVDVIALTPVRGGRRQGFRTFSRKTAFPAEPAGRWAVDVMTGGGQLVGRLRFRVVS